MIWQKTFNYKALKSLTYTAKIIIIIIRVPKPANKKKWFKSVIKYYFQKIMSDLFVVWYYSAWEWQLIKCLFVSYLMISWLSKQLMNQWRLIHIITAFNQIIRSTREEKDDFLWQSGPETHSLYIQTYVSTCWYHI